MDEALSMINILRNEVEILSKRVNLLEEKSAFSIYTGATTKREERLAEKYGEFVNKTTAAQILGVTRATIYTMLHDGRIEGACEGKKVSTRSIARYLERKCP